MLFFWMVMVLVKQDSIMPSWGIFHLAGEPLVRRCSALLLDGMDVWLTRHYIVPELSSSC